MALQPSIPIRYPLLAVCGLSCRLCPRYQSTAASRCTGCKTEHRLGAACSIQVCALKKHGVGYCGDCPESKTCTKWASHREAGRHHDSFVSYQKLEDNIARLEKHGSREWERQEAEKERLLRRVLEEYNEGRSCSYFCLAVTLLGRSDIEVAVKEEQKSRPPDSDIKMRSKALRALLDRRAEKENIRIILRK